MRIITFFVTVSLLTVIYSTILLPQPMAGPPPPEPQLHLHRGTFNARIAGQVGPTSDLAAAAPGPYAIIQLSGPISQADREALEQTGLKLLEYLPDYAYLVKGTPAQLRDAAALPQVYARIPFALADKFPPALLRAIARQDDDIGKVQIIAWPDDKGALARDLKARGLGQQLSANTHLLVTLAHLESVRWIEPVGQPRIVNDHARAIMNVEPVWQNHQLFGTDQIIAVADTGLDTGDQATLSPDFAGRIVAAYPLTTTNNWIDEHGHGTHVAGSVGGAGVQSGANPAQHDYADSLAGIAPEVSMVIQGFEADELGNTYGIPSDYYQIFAQAYTDGARLHTNSWGDYTGPTDDEEAKYGGYPYGSQRTDEFIWDHPDMAIFFAAGNSGKDGDPFWDLLCNNGNGVIDPDSLIYPGTAKNVITVGATESDRSTGGVGSSTWPDLLILPLCFLVDPIASDTLADDPKGMAAFSSRGPADDGRVKPDIVAPGTNIVSNRSHYPGASTLWGVFETNDHYVYSGGTSMATPLTAGMGVLVRQWLVGQGLGNPSAAAVKAVLLNTTQDIAPGQYGTSTTQEIPFQRPNNVAGWGRADLSFIDAPPPYGLWVDDHSAGLVTGQVISYTYTPQRPLVVLTDTQPLRVMLTWTDPPASLSASAQLVNDLDLVIMGPDGTTYYGNTITSADRINNVEGIVIQTPMPGSYQVMVAGFNVPISSQPYALVVAGPIQTADALSLVATKTASVTAAEVGSTITYTYRVINTGNITLTGIIANDDKLGTVPFQLSSLDPKQGVTATLTYTVLAADLPGPLTNTVTVTGTNALDPGIQASASAIESVDLTSTAEMTLTKRADVDTAELGQVVTYTYQVTNTGNVTLTGIIANDDKLGPVLFTPDTLTPTQAASAWLTHTIQPGDLPGPLTNTVTATGTNALDPGIQTSASATESVDLTTTAEMTVTKRADVDTAQVGQVVTYTYQVTNTGNITLTDITANDDRLGPVLFDPDMLAPTQVASAWLTYTIQLGDLPGPLTNTVTVTGTNALDPGIQATASTTESVDLTTTAEMTITKWADVNTAQVGQVVTYTYQVTNTGNITLTGISANDDKLGPVLFTPSTLAPTQAASAWLTYTIQVKDLPGPLINTAIVSGTVGAESRFLITTWVTETVSLQGGSNFDVYLPLILK